MSKIIVSGEQTLAGRIYVSGAKNSGLPVMVASLLTEEELIISNLPDVVDITNMANLLSSMGTEIRFQGSSNIEGSCNRVIGLKSDKIVNLVAHHSIMHKMRASIIVMGALLARFGKAIIAPPGGCAIGVRPIDMHLSALEKMGARIKMKGKYIYCSVEGKLKGCEITFPKPSVGATENVMMAATLAEGITTIHNAAKEPEIEDLADCLIKMGAKVSGAGTSTIIVEGVEKLYGAEHKIIGDRIEAGTYAVAAAITNSCLKINGAEYKHLESMIDVLKQIGMKITCDNDNEITVDATSATPKPLDITTEPFPGFPTDLQAQFMTLLAVTEGTSIVNEFIHDNRFKHALELNKMGGNIKVNEENTTATITGVKSLKGAEVVATDLRASASLILAGLKGAGETVVLNSHYLFRGYDNMVEKLANCGVKIRVSQ